MFTSKLFGALLAATVALAQNPTKNSVLAITQPGYGEVVNAGSMYQINWAPSLAIPVVDIVLREGNMANFEHEDVIARGVPNTGVYTWSVPWNLATSVAMSIMIHDSRDPSIVNYSPYFTIYGYPQLEGAEPPKYMTSSSSTSPRHTETIKLVIQEKHPHRMTEDSRTLPTNLVQNVIKLDEPKSTLSMTEMQHLTSSEDSRAPGTSSLHDLSSSITTPTTSRLFTHAQGTTSSPLSSKVEPMSNHGTYLRANFVFLSIMSVVVVFW